MAEPGQKRGSVRLVAFRARLWEAVASGGQSPDARPSARWRPQRPSLLLLGLCPAPRRILPRPGLPSRIPPTLRRSPRLGLWGSVGCRREAPELPKPDSSLGSGLARGAAWANLRSGGCSRQLQKLGTPRSSFKLLATQNDPPRSKHCSAIFCRKLVLPVLKLHINGTM
ncbi:uncharacterized protein LOC102412032 [Bubalus bubalis]|uniref:uncharacterized protein LOC102412032 n=1 Tax=Bubalus bubalis TaxID=89462 RepID=UPI001D0FFF13|nr:uncharacterized protein LOC102412032 [Bubalus bubalis]